MLRKEKPLAWLRNEVKTPPFSQEARYRAGLLLRRLQKGEKVEMPDSRPMPDAIVIGDVFEKKTQKTPSHVIDSCKKRFRLYELAVGGKNE